ncbi:MAG TPA: acyl-CoA dehydrogenase family protein, partial [Candidatus Hydrogenedentes bacterium]|nr:acyl-CoA dehydrogenase family protein [Candidatus Hydrogenedentota bacterium]
MATNVSSGLYATHEVINQPSALCDYNVYEADTPLKEAVQREGAGWAEEAISAFGAKMGSAEYIEYGRLANTVLPVLQTHDRFGHRRDEVEFHPAWHECMRAGVEAEVHALPWNHPKPGAHVARAAKHYMLSQVESGCCCPLTMTFAGVPGLRQQPDVAKEWLPRIMSTTYDSRNVPASEKAGCIMGMAMTEKQGGSDVRANTTRAVPLGKEGPGQEYFLTGHKWFVSAPMSDVFLTLAYTEKGLSCFLVPKWLPDGTRNRFFILRLKDKLGNKSNASSEVEYCDTWSRMVGEEGHGVRTIMEMVNHTRLDCSIGTAGIMRQALAQALHNARNRKAFDLPLSDQPLMRNVLADLALESEAATTMIMRVVHFYDELAQNASIRPLARLATAITKFWICKRAPNMVYEALECLGGSGYVEECI